MTNSVLNGLELYRSKWFSDLVDENMLSKALMTKPHEVSTILSYLFGTYEQANNVLDYLTSGMGKTMTVQNRQYEWPVMIEHDKAIEIYDAKWGGAAIISTDTPGINNSVVQLYLKEKWFGTGAVLALDKREFQVRVTGEPYQDGDYFVYSVVLADGKPESYILPSLLSSGSRVSREGSAYEEYSEDADIVNYNTPFKLRNQLTTMRLQYDITGDAFSSVMVIAMKGPNGKTSYLWSDYQEWQALRQWYKTIERYLVYSQYNTNADGTTNVKGTNGRPVHVGAGLLQQISSSNRETYTKLTAELLEDYLFNLSYNILGRGERKFVALTGEMGMKEFDRVLKEKASAYNLIDTKFISGSGQELTLGGQFVTYKMLNGVELTLKHMPLYDDPIYNRELHPISNKPLESYRMTFIDFGMRDGESNVQKVVRKDREMVMWHIAGSVAPSVGHAKSISTLRANARDGYSVNFLTEQGIMMKDPTTSGELIMEVQ